MSEYYCAHCEALTPEEELGADDECRRCRRCQICGALEDARSALRDGACEDCYEADGDCSHCGGSGGGPDAALRCPYCRGRG